MENDDGGNEATFSMVPRQMQPSKVSHGLGPRVGGPKLKALNDRKVLLSNVSSFIQTGSRSFDMCIHVLFVGGKQNMED